MHIIIVVDYCNTRLIQDCNTRPIQYIINVVDYCNARLVTKSCGTQARALQGWYFFLAIVPLTLVSDAKYF